MTEHENHLLRSAIVTRIAFLEQVSGECSISKSHYVSALNEVKMLRALTDKLLKDNALRSEVAEFKGFIFSSLCKDFRQMTWDPDGAVIVINNGHNNFRIELESQ